MNNATLVDAILEVMAKQADPYEPASLPAGFASFRLPKESPPMSLDQAKALRASLRKKLAADPGFLAALGGAVDVIKDTIGGVLA